MFCIVKKFQTLIFFVTVNIFSGLFFISSSAYAQDEEIPAALIKTSKAQYGYVTPSVEYIGKVEAAQTVNICPELSARISKVFFKEGAFVKAGETLFTLNAGQFQATINLRKAELTRAEANLNRAQKYFSRLKAADTRSVPAADVDTAEAEVKQAQAEILEAKAQLQLAQIDLNNTRIKAQISGRIGRALYTAGNYVTPGTVLAVIVQVDPIRVSFNMPDRDFLQNKNLDGRASLILADGSIYEATGSKEFNDNVMNSDTGTITTWLKFENKNNKLFPGGLVRVELSSDEERFIVIPQTAVIAGSDG